MTEDEFDKWYNHLSILPYGELSDEEFKEYVITILTWKEQRIFISDDIPENKFTVLEYWLLLGLLEDCIDYGSSPRGAWLTDFGKEVLEYLRSNQ